MSTAREQILKSVRRSLKRPADGGAQPADVATRLAEHPRGPIPERSDVSPPALVDLFRSQAEAVHATVAHVANWDDLPGAVADYLRQRNLPGDIVLATHSDLRGLNWAVGAPVMEVREGAPAPDTHVGVSRALAGVAETGTLMLRSGADSPTTLNFLPATHIVALHARDIVGPYEDAWTRLRAEQGEGTVPRAVNLVTGPSRTADIEQKLQLGAHGPMDLHILVVGHVE